VKVHVTLEAALVRDPAARAAALEQVLRAGRMTLANPGRFERHAIITGEISAERLEDVRAVPGVLAAEVDDQTPLE
jgi:hypothetical protein